MLNNQFQFNFNFQHYRIFLTFIMQISLFLKTSIILVTIIYLFAINFRKTSKPIKPYKSTQKANFTAFIPSNAAISDEEALNYMPK